MEASTIKIETLFNKGRTLEVPFFQRSYVWEEENWERFLDDMEAVSVSKKDYFMGATILKQQPTPSNETLDLRLLIDGQQRFTTIIIFFKLLSKIQNKPEMFSDTFYNRKKQIILQHNHNDIEIFEAIVKGKLTPTLEEKYKNNNILQCYRYFAKQEESLQDISINSLLGFLYFLGIDLTENEDEQQIFDTINSLGVSLTTAELLKNKLFRKEDTQLYEKTWKATFEGDENIRKFWEQKVTAGRQYRMNIDLFLQSFLLIISHANDKYIGIDNLFINYTKFLENNYKDNKTDFISNLIDYTKLYKENIQPDYLNNYIDETATIERLNIIIFGLNITTIVPYILYLLKEVSDDNERNKMFGLLETYLIRRLICKITTKNYNNLFASFIRNETNNYNDLKEKLESDGIPDETTLETSFQKNHLTNQQAKIILYLLEITKYTGDGNRHSNTLLPVNKYSLEHIMPKQWEKNWSENLSGEEKEKRSNDKPFLKLGNLTIISGRLNSSINNGAWQEKKDGKGKNKGLNFYSSGITILAEYLQKENWAEEEIKERGEELFKHASEIWKI